MILKLKRAGDGLSTKLGHLPSSEFFLKLYEKFIVSVNGLNQSITV